MSQVNVSTVHVDAALTNLAIGYGGRQGLIADQAMRILRVNKESDKYYKWDRGNTFRIPESKRSDGAKSNKVVFDLSQESYQTEEYALNTDVTDRQVANADSVLRLRASKMRFVKDLLMLDREKRVASLLTTTGNYDSTAYVTKSGSTQWNNASFSGSIEKDIDTGKEAVRSLIGVEPNTIIIPAAVAKVMKRDAMIRELIKYTQNDLLVNGDLPPTIFNMRVLIPTPVEISSIRGASSTTTADVWGKHVVMTYIPAEGSIDTPAHAYTFRSRDFLVKSWREEAMSKEVIECSVMDDEKITSNISGYLIYSCIS
jgi:hypothetical protein